MLHWWEEGILWTKVDGPTPISRRETRLNLSKLYPAQGKDGYGNPGYGTEWTLSEGVSSYHSTVDTLTLLVGPDVSDPISVGPALAPTN